MEKKYIALSVVLSVLVSVGVYTLAPEKPVQIVEKNPPSVQGFAGPDLASRYFSFGGVRQFAGNTQMQVATTTLCAIQSPAATSSLEFVSWSITTGTGTAATIDIGIGTTAFATSTNLVSGTSVGSGALGSAYWSSVGGSTGDSVLAPNTYVLVKTTGPGVGGYTYGGTCQAMFTQLVY